MIITLRQVGHLVRRPALKAGTFKGAPHVAQLNLITMHCPRSGGLHRSGFADFPIYLPVAGGSRFG
jgi:hypothetical protein